MPPRFQFIGLVTLTRSLMKFSQLVKIVGEKCYSMLRIRDLWCVRIFNNKYVALVNNGLSNYISKAPQIIDLQCFKLIVVLSKKDSNPHRRNQNPTCYHYTIGQSLCQSEEVSRF